MISDFCSLGRGFSKITQAHPSVSTVLKLSDKAPLVTLHFCTVNLKYETHCLSEINAHVTFKELSLIIF